MMVVDIYVEGDESDADMEWHNHGSTCVEWARKWWRGSYLCVKITQKENFVLVCVLKLQENESSSP